MERWATLDEAPSYAICTDGTIKHLRMNRPVRIKYLTRSRRAYVELHVDGRQVQFFVDELIGKYFERLAR